MCAKAKVASLIIYTNARITACQLVARPAAWRDVFLSHITAHASLCVYVCVCAVYALLPLLHVCVSTLSVIVVCGPLCQCPLHSLPAKRHTLPHFASLFHFLPLPPSISLSTHTTPVVNIFRSCRSRSGRPHDMVGAVASLLISLQFAFATLSLVSAALKLCSPFRSDLALYYLSHYSLSLLCYCCNWLCWSSVVGRWLAGSLARWYSPLHLACLRHFILHMQNTRRTSVVPSTIANERMRKLVVVAELAFVAAASRLLIADYARVLTQTCIQNLLNVNMHLKYKYLCIWRCYCCYCRRCYFWHGCLCSLW